MYFAILPILSAVLCIALGIFTFSRNPWHLANIAFMLGMASLTIIEVGNAMVLLAGTEMQIALMGMQFALIGQAVLPASWLFFSIVFARVNYKEILSRWGLVLTGVGIISALFSLWVGSPEFISLSSYSTERGVFEEGAPHFILGPTGRYFYIYLIIGLVLNLIQLENTLRSSSGSKRWRIKYVIFGVGAIFAFFIYLSSQALLFSTLSIETIPVISAIIFISVSIMALFIVRHRLLDVDVFISRYVVYNSLTVLIVGFYLLTVGIITYGIKYFHIPFNYFFTTLFIFISILTLVILLFTARLRRKVQLFINRHFYKHKYEFRDKWMETIERISSKRDNEEIEGTLTSMVSETMGARDVYLWLYDPVSGDYYATQDRVPMDFKRVAHNHPLLQHIKTNMGPFMINELQHKEGVGSTWQGEEINKLVTKTRAVLCTPLVAGQEVIGFILQGGDFSGETYRQDDFELLKAMTTQAAVQIKNIRLAQDIMASKEAEAFHRMSSFIIHDLKNLTNSLSLVSQNARYNIDNPEFQQDAIKTIDTTVSRMKELIERLSSMPKGFELKREKVDLKGLVHNTLKKVCLPGAKNVVVTNGINNLPLIYVDPNAMEMVFLNLFTNAYEAIQREGEIRVQSAISEGYINVTISDNGVGMSKEFIEKALFQPFKTTKKGGFGIGLYQCKAIVEAHGGRIEVESEEGKGTRIRVKLPLGDRG
ncbi:MAG: PEP-CTERM system histidine kinase PrsK [Deltaproteobacteria bacterium]|nr:PEP-CTERM system histidine kinase PrsK [Deltaproteobacteria bacterium]